ncbi:hypothetical protein B0H21DRAFT_733815 [Amylocystis lapponica]|nr:hypothetical protein B0H21DRAFT_733815 [Amylocystis lapponica]
MALAHAYPASPLAMARRPDIFSFLVGWSVLMLGVLLRLACFRELGRLFTFEVTLRRNHRLVTSGPYAFVRHPSYIALVMVFAGMSTCIVGPGSWAMECGALDTRGGMALAATWMVSGTYGIVQLLRRTPVEDRIMQEEFGEAWREWATRVPWRLIPGVY